MFTDLTKKTLAFSRTLFKQVFQPLLYYSLALGLLVHTRFDDLDHVSRLQVCQSHRLQMLLDSCPLSFKHCIVLTLPPPVFAYIKKVRHSMLCVTGVLFKKQNLHYSFNYTLECESPEQLLALLCIFVFVCVCVLFTYHSFGDFMTGETSPQTCLRCT